ncbi:MAG: T9SS type A sorting domain-containing protein, partial [bacterium]
YWENFDPDGRGNKFSPSTWVIVHDNWPSTAKHVAIPWLHWTGTVAVKVTPITAVESDMRGTVVEEFSLYQNYPNPFNPETVISFTVKNPSYVMLKLYDLLGNEVRILADELYPAGVHRVRLDASDMAAGVYLYRIQMGDFEAVRKMVVLR